VTSPPSSGKSIIVRLLLLLFPILFLLMGEQAHAFLPPASGSVSHGLSTKTPASARWRLLCRRESVVRLAKSGSFVALRPAFAP
jgi:hypothetical protein